MRNYLEEVMVSKMSPCFKESFWCSSRWVFLIMSFLGLVNVCALRVNMSVAIVCMTEPDERSADLNDSRGCNTSDKENMQSNLTNDCYKREVSDLDDRFDWNKQTQGLILGAFFVGYIPTQLPGGWLASKYNGKRICGWCMFLCAVATLLTPLAARSGAVILIVTRAIAGLCQGMVIPCLQTLISHWIPPHQRSTAVGFIYAGMQIGAMVAFPVCGVLCEEGFDGGWPSIFYILGGVCIVWCLAWMYLVHDSPVSHPRISDKERDYIIDSLKLELDVGKKSSRTPWAKIFTSLPFWAIVVSQTTAEWGLYTFLTNIPSYMKDVLKFDIEKTGYLSALPYLCFWMVSNISATLADFLQRRGYLRNTTIRKIFSSIGNIVPAVSVIIMGNASENPEFALAMLTIGVAISGCQFGSGFLVNPLEIAPRYAGILIGISNTVGAVGGFFAPYAIGIITVDSTREQWKLVFYITAAIYTFGAIFYVIFASSDLQPWARDITDTIEINVSAERNENPDNTVTNKLTTHM